jgi:hypothetical protein
MYGRNSLSLSFQYGHGGDREPSFILFLIIAAGIAVALLQLPRVSAASPSSAKKTVNDIDDLLRGAGKGLPRS